MKDFRESISDYLEGKTQGKYSILLAKWHNGNSQRKQTLQHIKNNLFKCQKTAEVYEPNIEAAYDQILQQIKVPQKEAAPTFSISHFSLPQRVAASLVIIILSASLFYFYSAKDTNINWRQLATQNEFKDLVLEDGSHVWLHRNSQLEYPEHFTENKREILVKGEAFIEVQSEASRPFFIKTAANSEIQVMGTALNIRSFTDETEEEIAVASGEVMYRCAANSRPEMKLDKGECAVWHVQTGEIDKMQETDPNIFSWKDHLITFKNADCKTFEKILERYFKVEVAIKDSSLYQTRFSAQFKNKNLNQILDYFNANAEVAHEIKKDTCYLWKR